MLTGIWGALVSVAEVGMKGDEKFYRWPLFLESPELFSALFWKLLFS